MKIESYKFRANNIEEVCVGNTIIPRVFKVIEGSREFELIGKRDQYNGTYHIGDATLVVEVSDGVGAQGMFSVASRDKKSLANAVSSLEVALGVEYTLSKDEKTFE